MEEEPESARPEEGKSQDGECHSSASTELGWGGGFNCCIAAGGEQKAEPRVRGVMDALLEAEAICLFFPSKETMQKRIKRPRRKLPMTK